MTGIMWASNAARGGGASPPTSGSLWARPAGVLNSLTYLAGNLLLGPSLQRAISSNALLGSRDGLQTLWGSLRPERRHWRVWSGTLAGMTWGDGGHGGESYAI